MVNSIEPVHSSLALPVGRVYETVHLDEGVEVHFFSEEVVFGCTLLLVQADLGVFLTATLLVRLKNEPSLIYFLNLPRFELGEHLAIGVDDGAGKYL